LKVGRTIIITTTTTTTQVGGVPLEGQGLLMQIIKQEKLLLKWMTQK
jgi:hypothetical protein